MLGKDFYDNISLLSERLAVDRSFDIIKKHLKASGVELCFFYIDGFTKDGEMQKLMGHILGMKSFSTVNEVMDNLPYIELSSARSEEDIITAVLSGQSAMICESFPDVAILIDARTYPARQTAEPDTDRVMQGARDGFVETLVMNTALIRRRIRDTRLRMEHINIGGASKTDVVISYMDGIADEKIVSSLREKIKSAKPKSLTLGYKSLTESIIRHGWLNPFPKVRTTERPDTASSELMEGKVLVICDTTPQVMILPTSIFDYLEQADDFYFPPLTGTYLRIVRTFILLLSVLITPLWYLVLEYDGTLPQYLQFLVPDEPGALPIIFQLLLVEVAIDGLKIASMNTPNMLSNSLSVVGALILGDFAVGVGWLCEDVILYMAFVALASFAQQNAELGYAFKAMRIMFLIFVFGFGVWGLLIGGAVFALAIATNRTVSGDFHYLYPLIPFEPRALKRILFRVKKNDFEN